MSWTASATITGNTVEDVQLAPGDITPAQREQFQLAKAGAKKIIDSGTVGSADKTYLVSLSGNANPGHVGNDSITISVTQAV